MAINTGVYTQQSVNQLGKSADSIPNYNVWTALAKGAIRGYGAFLDARSQQRELSFGATTSRMTAQTARMNAEFAQRQAKYNAQNSLNDMYATYRMYEHQAMLQGLADSQQRSKQQAVTASSGVRINQGSKREIDDTNRIAGEINQKAIQENAVRSASAYKLQSVNAEVTGLLEQANYMAQALIAEGDAKASDIMAKAIDPLGSGLLAFGTTVASSMMASGSFGGGSSVTQSVNNAFSGTNKFSFKGYSNPERNMKLI